MEDLKKIAKNIGVNYRYLKNLILFSDKYYLSHTIKKRTGGNRRIDSPNYEVKTIQYWILRNILERIEVSNKAHGFVKGRSIKSNAKPHLNSYSIVCFDIKDFFYSIKKNQITEIFMKSLNGKYKEVANELAKICTYNGYLPQGAVTSPYLSNIIFKEADKEIENFCSNKKIRYTRYADDLSFSVNRYIKLEEIEIPLKKIIEKHGFNINDKKSRLYFIGGRMMITGVILNSKKLTVGRPLKREIRAMIHNYLKKDKDRVNINDMLGKIAFLRDIEPDYYKNNLTRYIRKIKKLSIN